MELRDQVNYCLWRIQMWSKHYGSYRAIDAAVAAGELVPGREYPERQPEFADVGSGEVVADE